MRSEKMNWKAYLNANDPMVWPNLKWPFQDYSGVSRDIFEYLDP